MLQNVVELAVFACSFCERACLLCRRSGDVPNPSRSSQQCQHTSWPRLGSPPPSEDGCRSFDRWVWFLSASALLGPVCHRYGDGKAEERAEHIREHWALYQHSSCPQSVWAMGWLPRLNSIVADEISFCVVSIILFPQALSLVSNGECGHGTMSQALLLQRLAFYPPHARDTHVPTCLDETRPPNAGTRRSQLVACSSARGTPASHRTALSRNTDDNTEELGQAYVHPTPIVRS